MVFLLSDPVILTVSTISLWSASLEFKSRANKGKRKHGDRKVDRTLECKYLYLVSKKSRAVTASHRF
jgi:hypothetical protein